VRRAQALAFPVALFAFACLFFGGDVGRWNDDYFFNQRDPTTGAWSSLILTRRSPYLPPAGELQPWRPIHFVLTPMLLTLFWNHGRVINIVGVLLHASTCLVLYRLMRELGRSVHTAAGCACLFMVWAAHYEVVFWASAFSTGLAAQGGMWLLILTIRFARGAGVWPLAPMLALAWVVPRLNEQATGLIAAVPLAYLATCPAREPWGRRLGRAFGPAAACAAIVLLYLLGVWRAPQPGIGTDAASYVHGPLNVLLQFRRVVGSMFERFVLRDVALGAASLGWRSLEEAPAAAVAWLLVLAGGAVVTGRAFVRTPAFGGDAAPAPPARPWLDPLMALAAVLGAGASQAGIVGYTANSRTSYLMIACLFVAIAWAADTAARGLSARLAPGGERRRRLAVYLALVPLAVAGGVATVGAQARFHLVAVADARQGAQLKAQVPDPAPRTVFVPLAEKERRIGTGQPSFDEDLLSVWHNMWSLPFFVKNLYHRADVYCGFVHLRAAAVTDVTAEYVQYGWRFDTDYPMHPDWRVDFPWTKVIPFEIDERGDLRVVTRLRYFGRDGRALVIDVPQTAPLVVAGRLPEHEFTLDRRRATSTPQRRPTAATAARACATIR
jgi:hypothetical protein